MADPKPDLRHTADELIRYTKENSPPVAKAVAVAALFPFGGFLLSLSALSLSVTVILLAVTTPLFFLFSPVLVTAGAVIAFAVLGFLAAGALGLTAVTALTWIVKYVRSGGGQVGSSVSEGVEKVRKKVGDVAGQIGQKSRDVGHSVQAK